jgi:hypothetical protein
MVATSVKIGQAFCLLPIELWHPKNLSKSEAFVNGESGSSLQGCNCPLPVYAKNNPALSGKHLRRLSVVFFGLTLKFAVTLSNGFTTFRSLYGQRWVFLQSNNLQNLSPSLRITIPHSQPTDTTIRATDREH